jgi:hypothetical protein
LEEDLMFLSMSMSLSMALGNNPAVTFVTDPTPPPTGQSTQSPTSQPSIDVASISTTPTTSSLVDEETLSTEAAVNTPLGAEDNASLDDDGPNVAAILSAVSGILLVAVILRKLKRRSTSGQQNKSDSDYEEEHHTVTNPAV